MKVEIWSDVACPFCYIGKHRFEEALKQFSQRDEIAIEYKSFELDPNAEREPKQDLAGLLSKKYGVSREQAIAMNRQVQQSAADIGLVFNFDRAIPANTHDAHRLVKLAGRYDRAGEAMERLYEAYFVEGRNVADKEALADIAAALGIDRSEALTMLGSAAYSEEVRADSSEAGHLGARGVPFFVINRKYAVGGAQPAQVFLDTLQKAWADAHPLIMNDAEQPLGDGCSDGSCKPDRSNS